MSVVYIQLSDGLKKISDEEYSPSKNDVVEALGYTPVDPANMPDVSNEENDVLYVTDKDGNIIAKIDAEGLHTVEVEAGGIKLKETLVQHAQDYTNAHVSASDRKKWDDNSVASDESVKQLAQSVADMSEDVAEAVQKAENVSSALTSHETKQKTDLETLKKAMSEQIVSESEEWHVVDSNGNIVATINAQGVHTTELWLPGGKVSEHVADTDVHVTAAEKAKWNNPSQATKESLGLGNVDNTSDANKPVSTAQQAAIDAVNTRVGNHVLDKNNPHGVDKSDVGLDQVDNTSDADKPVSTAQQAAIDAAKRTVDITLLWHGDSNANKKYPLMFAPVDSYNVGIAKCNQAFVNGGYFWLIPATGELGATKFVEGSVALEDKYAPKFYRHIIDMDGVFSFIIDSGDDYAYSEEDVYKYLSRNNFRGDEYSDPDTSPASDTYPVNGIMPYNNGLAFIKGLFICDLGDGWKRLVGDCRVVSVTAGIMTHSREYIALTDWDSDGYIGATSLFQISQDIIMSLAQRN